MVCYEFLFLFFNWLVDCSRFEGRVELRFFIFDFIDVGFKVRCFFNFFVRFMNVFCEVIEFICNIVIVVDVVNCCGVLVLNCKLGRFSFFEWVLK